MSDQLSLFGGDPEGQATTVVDADATARDYARNPDHSVVLEASAGTGKTSVLVSRYVNLLTRGVDPANILAITFTRKAAAEMRERIIRDLRRAAELSAFDRARWTTIRDRLADIQISTIDAFCLALLREFPLEADLDPGFGMADETEVPRLVDQSLDKSLATFIALAKREPDLALVLAQLGLTRTREGLAYLLQRRLVAWDVLDRFLARGPADLDADSVCARAVASLIDLFSSVSGGLPKFLADGPVHQPRYQLLARDLRRLDAFRTADNAAVRGLMNRIAQHFLRTDGKPRTSDRIHPYRNDDYPNAEAGRRHRLEALRLGPHVENIVRAFSRDLNVVLARGVRRMFQIALAHYRIALDERSLLDFSDVLQRAVDLLGRMDEFSQSRFRLEGRYHHVLVDEFQDTSRKQWELVSLLIKAWGEGLGLATDPSIFIVGDRKQSIYRFRDAEVAVLQEAGSFIEGLRPGRSGRRSIARSFRSVPELLSFVNDLFGEIGGDARRPDDFKYDEDDRFPVDTAVVPPKPSIGEGGPLSPALGIITGADADQCAAAVAAEISRILREDSVRDKQTGVSRRARAGDIGILFRSRTSHREFESALEAAGVPTYVYKGLGFFDADEIKDVSALIRFLANPSSDLRAAAFLRSRFVRLSDAALAALAPGLAAAVTDAAPPAAIAALSDDDRRALDQARRHVPGWIAQVDRLPPADLIEQLLPETAYAYEIRGGRRQQAWENLKKMRGLIRRIQNRGYATLARIADHLDSLTAGDESNAVLEALDAVNLMTVHASKGLEFPIVFVVNLARGASGLPRPVRVSGEDVSVGPFVSDSDEEERFREREETKRLLYVAITRARDRLYLSSSLKDGALAMGRGCLAEILPESFRAVFPRAAQEPGSAIEWTSHAGHSYRFRICRAPAAVTAPGQPSQIDTDTGQKLTADEHILIGALPCASGSAPTATVTDMIAPVGEPGVPRGDEALVGTLLHRLIQRHPRQGIAAAARLLKPEEHAAAADPAKVVARALDLWGNLLARPDVAELLATDERIHEMPFSFVDERNTSRVLRGTIDCLVRQDDGSFLVLEFKTGPPSPDHSAQLDVYVRAVRSLYRDCVVAGKLVYCAPGENGLAADSSARIG